MSCIKYIIHRYVFRINYYLKFNIKLPDFHIRTAHTFTNRGIFKKTAKTLRKRTYMTKN